MNKFLFSDDNKRYHTLSYFNKHKFGTKVHKASVDAGLTCPNIDGTKGFEGCIYCDGGSNYFSDGQKPIKKQIKSEIDRIRILNPLAKFIVYYQANSNTYTSDDNLKEMIETAMGFNDVIGVTLSTRSDCVNKNTIKVLDEYRNDTNLCVELGLQTTNSETIRLINRCQTYQEFLDGFNLLKENEIRTCVHIINSLPYETDEMMMQTAKDVGSLAPDALKIHMLHIIRGTKIHELYEEKIFDLLTKEEYVDLVVRQLEYIPKTTVIERLTGDGDKQKLIAPEWTKDKISVLGAIDKLMAQKNTYQGIKISDK